MTQHYTNEHLKCQSCTVVHSLKHSLSCVNWSQCVPNTCNMVCDSRGETLDQQSLPAQALHCTRPPTHSFLVQHEHLHAGPTVVNHLGDVLPSCHYNVHGVLMAVTTWSLRLKARENRDVKGHRRHIG